MTIRPLEPAIQMLIDATNRGDSKALLGAFAANAVLADFGRTFQGRDEIARWDREENIGTENQIRVMGVRRTRNATKVAITVSGKGYNGPGHFLCKLRDGLIAELTITA